ncbi:hypothetical protein [Listeria innocua]|uniref:hypothetical protein n=1 Tax=Listeria innocua TaxID=1642 RepID=UPI00162A3163|nr:hypothetical protein [Listeria innocua]MBC1925547.1 hypothetical protein [Listeria innocua]
MKLWDFYSDLAEGKWDTTQILAELALGLIKAIGLFLAITVFFYLFAFVTFLGIIALIVIAICIVVYFVSFLSIF